MLQILIATAMLAGNPSSKPSRFDDTLHYSLGGIMSGPVDLSLNLSSGEFSLKETVPDPAGAQQREGSGKLSEGETSRIRSLAMVAVRKGFETSRCKRLRSKGNMALSMPIMDAIPSMSVRLDGRYSAPPLNIGCWSKVADDLVDAALSAARSALK